MQLSNGEYHIFTTPEHISIFDSAGHLETLKRIDQTSLRADIAPGHKLVVENGILTYRHGEICLARQRSCPDVVRLIHGDYAIAVTPTCILDLYNNKVYAHMHTGNETIIPSHKGLFVIEDDDDGHHCHIQDLHTGMVEQWPFSWVNFGIYSKTFGLLLFTAYLACYKDHESGHFVVLSEV